MCRFGHRRGTSQSLRFCCESFDTSCAGNTKSSASWACHNEGRHAALSGRYFLRALAREARVAGLTLAEARRSDFTRRLLKRDVAFIADINVKVAEAVEGTLVLSVQPSARRVGVYTAMDFAHGLAAWACRSLG